VHVQARGKKKKEVGLSCFEAIGNGVFFRIVLRLQKLDNNSNLSLKNKNIWTRQPLLSRFKSIFDMLIKNPLYATFQ